MADNLGLKVPFPDDQLTRYLEAAKDYAFMNGLILTKYSVKSEENNNITIAGDHDVVVRLPLTLIPTPVPRNTFRELKEIQSAYLEMYYNIAHDFTFLDEIIKPLANVDVFIGKLWKIHQSVKSKAKSEHRCLILARNDFMLEESTTGMLMPKQIEMNTVAVGLAGYGSKMKNFHEYMLRKMKVSNYQSEQMPVSVADEEFAKAMLTAWKQYGKENSAILFIVVNPNVMIYDHRYIEQAITRQNGSVNVIFTKLWSELFEKGYVTKDGALYLGDQEIGLVYFRTGIKESHMESDEAYKVRLMIESSRTILCPCIHEQLAGCKKVQQVLCQDGVVEKYLKDPAMAKRIRDSFVKQYSTDYSTLSRKGMELALKNPDNFVMKSQGDGGGQNLYGEDIVKKLSTIDMDRERGKFILMEKVRPKSYPNYLIFNSKPAGFGQTVSELGLFSSCLGISGHITTQYCGHFCKTKLANEDDGEILTGTSSLDSILLV